MQYRHNLNYKFIIIIEYSSFDGRLSWILNLFCSPCMLLLINNNNIKIITYYYCFITQIRYEYDVNIY